MAARRTDRQKTLGMCHLSRAMAIGTFGPGRSRSRAGSLTGGTALDGWNLKVDFFAKSGLLKIDGQIVPKIFTRLGGGPSPSASTGSESEKILENVTETREDVLKTSEAGEARASESLMPVQIVDLPLLRISERFIGLSGLLEPLFCVFVARISVRVVLEG